MKLQNLFVLGVLFTLGTIGCDSPDETTTDTIQPDVIQPTNGLTPWAPGATTTGVPTYGKNCRFAADNIFSDPSNGLNDDSITLLSSGSEATVSFTVNSSGGQVLNAQVVMARGLKDKSYRNASGTATFGNPPMSGSVVDGALCFADKLAAGIDAVTEFSLVIDTGVAFYSVAGTLTIPNATIQTEGPSIEAPAIAIDLK
jgi:hypothetical protein